jgi:hypothetical protein
MKNAVQFLTHMLTDYCVTDQSLVRKPGDRWMIRGPAEYVPPVEVEVVAKRTAIPLDVNEGIYVRNVKTGKVTSSISLFSLCSF